MDRRWIFGIDESGTKGTAYYGFGIVAFKYERRGALHKIFKEARRAGHIEGEIKWKKMNRESTYLVGRELVDQFFRRTWLAFHCMIVKKSAIEKHHHGGDYDLAWRKNLALLVSNKAARIAKRHPHETHSIRVWADKVQSRYAKAAEALHIIAGNQLSKNIGERCQIEEVVERDSKEAPAIQLADLLIGAVTQAWNGPTQGFKAQLQRDIASYLGWKDLRAGTFQRERKFNVWHFPMKGGARSADGRPVRLTYPLVS